MQLNLKNPLVFFDLETTGINISTDRIVEISYLKVYPDGREETKTMRINPGMPIPPEATAVHKITDADVAGCPTFKEVAKTIAADLEGCDLAGYNSNRFDVSAAYKFYCDKDLNDAHAAEADTRATYEVLKAQLDRYPQLKNDMAALADFTSYTRNVDLAGRIVYNDQGVEVFNFGKYKGRSVAEVFKVDTGYYGWMMQGEFPLNTKNVITNIKLRSFNQK